MINRQISKPQSFWIWYFKEKYRTSCIGQVQAIVFATDIWAPMLGSMTGLIGVRVIFKQGVIKQN